MKIKEAKSIRNQLGRKTLLTKEEEFLYTEVMRFLIYTEKRAADMMYLGEYYYDRKYFELALKYFEMAAECGRADANLRLGCIWYYGRVGRPDYEKAYFYFSKAKEQGEISATMLLADMYKYGQYVEADYDTYKQMIESLEIKAIAAIYTEDPLPEIFVRIAEIRRREGKFDIAEEYYVAARDFLAQRIMYNPSFANLQKMRELVWDYYYTAEFDADNMDLFDLYHCMGKPCRVTFTHNGNEYEVESVMEDEDCVIRFEGKWFRTIEDFFARAMIGEELLTSIFDEFGNYSVNEISC